jgi:hypothetical protein
VSDRGRPHHVVARLRRHFWNGPTGMLPGDGVQGLGGLPATLGLWWGLASGSRPLEILPWASLIDARATANVSGDPVREVVAEPGLSV